MLRLSNITCFFVIVLLCVQSSLAEPLPTSEAIREVISTANMDWEKFENESFMPRMQLELSGRLLNDNDKASFCEFADSIRDELDRNIIQQQAILEQIEKYEGRDWEQLYGATGMWRRLAASIEKTRLNKAKIDYYLALVCAGPQQQKALEEILSKLHSPSADILIAKILCSLSRIDEKYREPAEKQFSKMKTRSNWSHCEAIEALMEQIKCLGPCEPNELNNLTQAFLQSDCKNDREIMLSLAILQRRFCPDELQKTLSQYPETVTLLGKLLLNELSAQSNAPEVNFASISPIDADIAAATAWQTLLRLRYEGQAYPQRYAELITKLADSNRFQTPAVLYAAANLYQETRPQKAVELLIKASEIHKKQPDTLFKKTAEEMAEQAFNLAYKEFIDDPNDCQPAINAFENYSRITKAAIDEQTQYLYANLLNHCDRTDEAARTFKQLAGQTQSLWRDAANLELLKIELKKAGTPTEVNDVLARFHNFILNCVRPEERQTQLRLEAMNIYCTRLLEQDIADAAEKVLNILDTALPAPGLPYDYFKAHAFEQLGRLEESIHFISKTIDTNDCSIAPEAVSLLSEALDKIELWQQKAADYNQMLLDCGALADFSNKCLNSRQTALIFAEVLALQRKRGQESFPAVDENDINWLRAKARLLIAQGDYEHSARLWAKIAELRRNDIPEQNQKSWSWWQAKFYELDCLAKMPQTNKQNISHTIEVLQSTYRDIPSPWAEKLESLKNILHNSE